TKDCLRECFEKWVTEVLKNIEEVSIDLWSAYKNLVQELMPNAIEMFNKILLAIDNSKRSRKVFETGMSLAKTTGASWMLLQVLSSQEKNYPSPFRYYAQESETIDKSTVNFYQKHWQKLQQEGLESLQSLTEEATKAAVKTEFRQSFGYPGRNICELAQTWAAEVIILGSRGITGLKEMFLGSISNYVTHHAPCSVLIVRENIDELVSPKI
ncbi:MAG: universal stress protein, partial [Xenococcaceae cyanobacterium MO_167.B27]|nr:universal stress protein [Xenococcaceae cyanobacterium MO_167.B27]